MWWKMTVLRSCRTPDTERQRGDNEPARQEGWSDTCNPKLYQHKKEQGLMEQLEGIWGVKPSVILVAIGALVFVTLKLGEWLQQMLFPGTTSEIAVKLNIHYTNDFL